MYTFPKENGHIVHVKILHAKAAKSTFVTSEKNAYLSLSLYTSLWKIEN